MPINRNFRYSISGLTNVGYESSARPTSAATKALNAIFNPFDFLNKMISNVAEYGGLTRGERLIDFNVKKEMKQILSEIKNGQFKKEWDLEKEGEFKLLNKKRNSTKKSEIEKTTLQMLKMLKEKK